MSFLTTLFNGGDAIKSVGESLDKLFTSDDERLERKNELIKAQQAYDLEIAKLDAQSMSNQVDVNKIEAANTNIFISGWRPAIGWVACASLFYKFIAYPAMCWILVYYPDIHLPPVPDAGELYPLITGMLGLGAMRSFDKSRGVETK